MKRQRYYQRRYYRRRGRSVVATIVRDMVGIYNRLPWWGAALMGIFFFSFFHWVAPAWIQALWETAPAKTAIGELIHQTFERRLHRIQYPGIALGLIGAFFAIKNYFFNAARPVRRAQGWLSSQAAGATSGLT